MKMLSSLLDTPLSPTARRELGGPKGQRSGLSASRRQGQQILLSLLLCLVLLGGLLLAPLSLAAESEGLGTYTMYGYMYDGMYTPLEDLEGVYFLRFEGNYAGVLESFYFDYDGSIYYHGNDEFVYDVTQSGDIILSQIMNHSDAIFSWNGEIGVLQFKDYLGDLIENEYYLFMAATEPVGPQGQRLKSSQEDAPKQPNFPAPPTLAPETSQAPSEPETSPRPAASQPTSPPSNAPSTGPTPSSQPPSQPEPATTQPPSKQEDPANSSSSELGSLGDAFLSTARNVLPNPSNFSLSGLASNFLGGGMLDDDAYDDYEDDDDFLEEDAFYPVDNVLPGQKSDAGLPLPALAGTWVRSTEDTQRLIRRAGFNPADISFDLVYEISPEGKVQAYLANVLTSNQPPSHQAAALNALYQASSNLLFQGELSEMGGNWFSFTPAKGSREQANIGLEGDTLRIQMNGWTEYFVKAEDSTKLQGGSEDGGNFPTEEPAGEIQTSPQPDSQAGQAADERDFVFDTATGTITEYKGEAVKLFIPSSIEGQTVRAIGPSVFSFSSVEEVVLPAGLELIDEEAFSVTSLTKLVLPSSLKRIGGGAFSDTPLEEVNLPEGLREIGPGAFKDTRLKEIVLPASLELIGSSAFRSCELTKVEFAPQSQLRQINNEAFATNYLTSLILPPSLSVLGEGAFRDNELRELQLGSDQLSTMLDIGAEAFSNNQLENLVLPPSVLSIGASAFQGNALSQLVLPSYLEKLGESAFKDNSLSTVELPRLIYELRDQEMRDILIACFDNSVQGEQTPVDMTFFQQQYVSRLDAGNSLRPSKTVDLPVADERDFSFDPATGTLTEYHGESTEVVIPDTIDGQPVLALGENLFTYKYLTKLVLPASLQKIGPEAISYNYLTELDFPSGLQEIGDYALEGNWLESVKLPEGLVKIGKSAFSENRLLSINIPASVKWIGPEAFRYNRLQGLSLGRPSLLDSVLHYRSQGPSQLRFLGKGCFANNQLPGLYLPAYVEDIKTSAFEQNILGFLDIASNYPFTMLSIDDRAFADNMLMELYLPDSVYGLGMEAFRNNRIQELRLPQILGRFGAESFLENNLSTVTLPSFFPQSKEEDSRDLLIEFFDNNVQGDQAPPSPDLALSLAQTQLGAGRDQTMVLKYRTEPNDPSDFEFDAATGTITKYVGEDKQVIIPDMIGDASVLALGENSFAYQDLTYIEIPYSVQRLEAGCLQENLLTTINLPPGLEELGESCLSGNLLTNLVLPSGISVIDRRAVSGNKIMSLEIPDSVYSIGNSAFASNCLRSLTFREPSYLTIMGEAAFDSNELVAVELPNSLQSIGSYAFRNNFLAYTNLGSLQAELGEEILSFNFLDRQP